MSLLENMAKCVSEYLPKRANMNVDDISPGGIVIQGNSYTAKNNLKSDGFVWDHTKKEWWWLSSYGETALKSDEPLPVCMATDADLYLSLSHSKYIEIAKEWDISAKGVAVALNLPILYASGDISSDEPYLLDYLKDFVELVPAESVDMDGYVDKGEKVIWLKDKYSHYIEG